MIDKDRRKVLCNDFDFDKHEVSKIWSLKEDVGPNMLVDTSKSVQYLNDIKDHWLSSLQDCSYNGPLCGEEM